MPSAHMEGNVSVFICRPSEHYNTAVMIIARRNIQRDEEIIPCSANISWQGIKTESLIFGNLKFL